MKRRVCSHVFAVWERKSPQKQIWVELVAIPLHELLREHWNSIDHFAVSSMLFSVMLMRAKLLLIQFSWNFSNRLPSNSAHLNNGFGIAQCLAAIALIILPVHAISSSFKTSFWKRGAA